MRAVGTFWISCSRALLDLVYPPKCALCGEVGAEAICSACSATLTPLDRSAGPSLAGIKTCAVLYAYEGGGGKAVRRLKYDRVTSLAGPMARRMVEGARERGLLDVDIVVPVPIHWTRRCSRGFNQSELLSELLSREGGPPVRPRLLRRIRATRPQVGMDRARRIRNLSGAFRAAPAVAGLRVLLVDDVSTTGHTAEECARALKAAGAREVSALFFAGDVA